MVADLGNTISVSDVKFPDGAVVGLYGGSFNPAHEAHLHVAREALKRFQPHSICWLVSPHNPLKKATDLAPFKQRFLSAQKMARHPQLVVSDFEQRHHLQYSDDTIIALEEAYPRVRFFLMVGADNWANFHKWRNWRDIINRIPIAIFDRTGYSIDARCGPAAQQTRRLMVSDRRFKSLIRQGKPGWTYVPCQRMPHSSTAIRAAGLFRW